jgi:hypothetical protein
MTDYRLVTKPQGYKRAHKYLRSKGVECKLSFPTVIAIRDEEVVGVIGTHPQKDAIVTGPVEVNSRSVALRLSEAYDNVMRAAGISSYLMWVDKANQGWSKILRRLPGFVERGQDRGRFIYERTL